jgi:hypothetical protein
MYMTQNDSVIKQENIGYLKLKINLQQGTLTLTNSAVALDAHKTGVSGLGLLGAFLKKKVEKNNTVFNLAFADIKTVAQGKHGMQKNVLEITDQQNNTHRIIVKDYADWESVLRSKMSA